MNCGSQATLVSSTPPQRKLKTVCNPSPDSFPLTAHRFPALHPLLPRIQSKPSPAQSSIRKVTCSQGTSAVHVTWCWGFVLVWPRPLRVLEFAMEFAFGMVRGGMPLALVSMRQQGHSYSLMYANSMRFSEDSFWIFYCFFLKLLVLGCVFYDIVVVLLYFRCYLYNFFHFLVLFSYEIVGSSLCHRTIYDRRRCFCEWRCQVQYVDCLLVAYGGTGDGHQCQFVWKYCLLRCANICWNSSGWRLFHVWYENMRKMRFFKCVFFCSERGRRFHCECL